MSEDKFSIEFDNPSVSYWPDQQVTGRVIVVCGSDKKVDGLKIKIERKYEVKWSQFKQYYQESDVLKLYEKYVVGDGSTPMTIPAGRHEFPFSCTLPTYELPSSFVGKYGKVVYKVEAKMQRSWKLDQEVKAHFTVNAVVDLNLYPDLSEPRESSDSKKLCCFCCASGPIGYVLRIPKKGYVPGEHVSFEADIQNESSSNVKGVTVSLMQVNIFSVQYNSIMETKTLAKKMHGCVKAGTSVTWSGDSLQIPSVPPTGLGGCRLIDVQFFLKIELDIAGLALDLEGSVQIMVGTIPLQNTFANIISRPIRREFQFTPPIADYSNLPPPSYEEATRGNEPAAGTGDGEHDYLPIYANYRWTA